MEVDGDDAPEVGDVALSISVNGECRSSFGVLPKPPQPTFGVERCCGSGGDQQGESGDRTPSAGRATERENPRIIALSIVLARRREPSEERQTSAEQGDERRERRLARGGRPPPVGRLPSSAQLCRRRRELVLARCAGRRRRASSRVRPADRIGPVRGSAGRPPEDDSPVFQRCTTTTPTGEGAAECARIEGVLSPSVSKTTMRCFAESAKKPLRGIGERRVVVARSLSSAAAALDPTERCTRRVERRPIGDRQQVGSTRSVRVAMPASTSGIDARAYRGRLRRASRVGAVALRPPSSATCRARRAPARRAAPVRVSGECRLRARRARGTRRERRERHDRSRAGCGEAQHADARPVARARRDGAASGQERRERDERAERRRGAPSVACPGCAGAGAVAPRRARAGALAGRPREPFAAVRRSSSSRSKAAWGCPGRRGRR